jgi:hypothetical protein
MTAAFIGAAIMMAAIVSSAPARNLSSSSETFRTTWSRLTFNEPIFGLSFGSCPLTLEGSLHARTFVKGNYNLIGSITRGIVGPRAQCSGNDMTILAESLPWNIRYQSFTSTLPDITSIRTLISGASFRVHIELASATCLFTTRETVAEHASGRFNRNTATGEFTSLELGGEITSNEGCVSGARLRLRLISGASATLTKEVSGPRITLTLI